MISLNQIIQQLFTAPQTTQSPKGIVKGHLDEDGALWLSYQDVLPDGSYSDAITWKFVLSGE